ncbi:hypothetical protein, partial [Streptomyces sp. NPDC054901]
TPLPNLPIRTSTFDVLTEVLPGTAVLLVVAPDDCGPPGPVISPVAYLHQPWLRHSTTAPHY